MPSEPRVPVPGSSRRWPLLTLVGAAVLAGMFLVNSTRLLASTGAVNGSLGDPATQKRQLSEQEVEERIRAVASEPQSTGAQCRVLGPEGSRVTRVAAMSFGDLAYWLEYRSSGDLATHVRFTTMPLFDGSPALSQVQQFNTDLSNVVVVPFGVPDWGLDKTSGPWALVVRDDLGRGAVCRFEVVP